MAFPVLMCATCGGYRLNRLLRIRALVWMISNVTLLPGSITYRKYLERSAGLNVEKSCSGRKSPTQSSGGLLIGMSFAVRRLTCAGDAGSMFFGLINHNQYTPSRDWPMPFAWLRIDHRGLISLFCSR